MAPKQRKSETPNVDTRSKKQLNNGQAEAQATQVQVQRPRTVQEARSQHSVNNLNEETVSVHQSMEIMQTLLHSCISSVTYLRNLFRDECYDLYLYTQKGSWNYRDYASGKLRVDADIVRSKYAGLAVQALKRGVDVNVDKTLDLLEKGVFDALGKGYLQALIISIFADPLRPSDILEQYTFTFNYIERDSDNETTSRISSFDMKMQDGSAVTMGQARNSQREFIRQVIALCNTIPLLPKKCRMKMDIIYTDSRPLSYVPDGFGEPLGDAVYFPDGDWTLQNDSFATQNTGHHALILTLSHLKPAYLINSADDEEDSIGIPRGLMHTKAVNMLDVVQANLETLKTPRKSSQMHLRPEEDNGPEQGYTAAQSTDFGNLTQHNEAQQPFTVQDASETETDYRYHESEKQSTPKAGSNGGQPTTQELEQKRRLQGMLQPSIFQTDTQKLTQDSDSPAVHALQLLPSKIADLDRERSVRLPSRNDVSLMRHSDKMEKSSVVQCECGCAEYEGYMFQCEFCCTLQHVHCYGYVESNLSLMPSLHVCYRCLLSEQRDDTLDKAISLARTRRVLYHMDGQDFHSEKQLAEHLRYGTSDVARILALLRNEGLVVGPKKLRTGQKMALSHTEAAVQHKKKTYFDPVKLISHCLTGVRDVRRQRPDTQASSHMSAHGARKRGREAADQSVVSKRLGVDQGNGSIMHIDVLDPWSP